MDLKDTESLEGKDNWRIGEDARGLEGEKGISMKNTVNLEVEELGNSEVMEARSSLVEKITRGMLEEEDKRGRRVEEDTRSILAEEEDTRSRRGEEDTRGLLAEEDTTSILAE